MRALICLTCLLLAATAHAGPVYKWKDANGVTQYSENPPAGRAFETRQQAREPAAASAAAATGSPAAGASAGGPSAQCTAARENQTLLAGTGPLMQDTDGDGKADAPLADADRDNQRALADAAVNAWCAPAAG